ncbi:hypothetical protein AMTRI_Chr06g200110 [Amborella trichopoda]
MNGVDERLSMKNVGEVVVVAVDASKEITGFALEWGIKNIIKTCDTLVFLALLPLSHPLEPHRHHHGLHKFISSLLKKWGIGDEESKANAKKSPASEKITRVCLQMVQQLCISNHVRRVRTEVKIIENYQLHTVARQAQELHATWVVLDGRLKNQVESCLKLLKCSIVLVEQSMPKILRLNIKHVGEDITGTPTIAEMACDSAFKNSMYCDSSIIGTSPSSLGLESPTTSTNSSPSPSPSPSPDPYERATAPTNLRAPRALPNKRELPMQIKDSKGVVDGATFPLRSIGNQSPLRGTRSGRFSPKPPKPPSPARRSTDCRPSPHPPTAPTRPILKPHTPSKPSLQYTTSTSPRFFERSPSLTQAISLSMRRPPASPPLCSTCKHRAPTFGQPPKRFSHAEMEAATCGFSTANFLAEGGYGPVYRGVLQDGQVVAVKQHRKASAQGAFEFCAEVEVLSCAQHRNLVLLVGYCTEKEWLLVYEFACNGSLDQHLYGKERMAWEHRHKVAVGVARGLRYLHEDCRVGCIVHRDLRPNNILLTHDFEPMVGDFGLARWQADGQTAEETRVIGTFGYLAPEYTKTGQITEKADVYAFGVLLLELLTGQRAIDLSRKVGQQYLPDWARPLLVKREYDELMDPTLQESYSLQEAQFMMQAACLCITTDPQSRPRMSKVLRILEGDVPNEVLSPSHGTSDILSPAKGETISTPEIKERRIQNRRRWKTIPNHASETLNPNISKDSPLSSMEGECMNENKDVI